MRETGSFRKLIVLIFFVLLGFPFESRSNLTRLFFLFILGSGVVSGVDIVDDGSDDAVPSSFTIELRALCSIG